MKRLPALTVTTATLLAATCAFAPSAQSAPAKGGLEKKLVGTWEMTVDPRPVQGPTGPIDVPPFPSFVSLHAGGTLTDSVSSLAGAAKALLGADDYTGGSGAWAVSKKKTLKFRFARFFTKEGAYVGRQVVVGKGRVKGATTKQVATATFYDASGAQVGPSVTIDAKGTRVTP